MNAIVGNGNNYFNSLGDWQAYKFGVRTVISLKSNITTMEIKKLDNQNVTEDAWEGYSTSNFGPNGDVSNGEAGKHGN